MTEIVRVYWPVALFVLAGLQSWAIWSFKHGVASKIDLENESRRLEALSYKVDLLEVHLEHLPTGSDFTTVKVELAKLCSDSTSTCNYVRNLDAAIKRIESHLLKEK